jgi:putative spermidine/putrescine transport system permease protein
MTAGDRSVPLPELGVPRRVRVDATWLLVIPALLLLGMFFVLPYTNMLYMSFMTQARDAPFYRIPTLANYAEAMSDTFNWRIIFRTLMLGTITTVITLILSYPLAYHLARASSRLKGLLMTLLRAPLLVGVVVRSYGWMILLADTGLINQTLAALDFEPMKLMYNRTGVLIGLVHIYMPFMVLSLTGSLQGIDPDLERAARSLGAGRWRTFWRITWPLSLPGVMAGTVLVFVLAVSSYVIPSLLGGYNVVVAAMLIVQTVMDLFNWPLGSALAMIVFAVTIGLVWLYIRLMNRAMRGVQ